MPLIYVTMQKAEQIAGISRSTQYRLISDGRLKSIKARGRRLIEVQSLRALGSEEAEHA